MAEAGVLSGVTRDFTAAFGTVLEGAADTTLLPFVEAVRGIDPRRARDRRVGRPGFAALAHLPAALAGLRGDDRLARAIRATLPHLDWRSSYSGKGPSAGIHGRMIWAEIAGLTGFVPMSGTRLGLFLISPHLHYGLHGHTADEIYHLVSGRLSITLGLEGAEQALRPGETFRTPAGAAHALTTGAEPALIVYNWTGDVTGPVWWWRRREDGSFEKLQPDVVQR
ncbi:MAG: dimethylsulfonioproprionate lyase family protein [Hyphomicrobiaceae bacterium]